MFSKVLARNVAVYCNILILIEVVYSSSYTNTI